VRRPCEVAWSGAPPLTAAGARSYPTYLKPYTVSTWLKEAAPPEEYILIVDSDMLFRRPLLPGPLGVQLGTAASQNQWCAPRSGTLPSACRRAGPPKPLRREPACPPKPPPRAPPPPFPRSNMPIVGTKLTRWTSPLTKGSHRWLAHC